MISCLSFLTDNCVKDLTSRYASNWLSKTRKLRVDADWLAETLHPYKSRNRVSCRYVFGILQCVVLGWLPSFLPPCLSSSPPSLGQRQGVSFMFEWEGRGWYNVPVNVFCIHDTLHPDVYLCVFLSSFLSFHPLCMKC